MNYVRKKIITIVAKNLNDSFDLIEIENSDFIDDFGMDSLDFISIIIELEEEFKIQIPNDLINFDNFRTVLSIETIIDSIMSKKKELQ